ncbi:MAG: hypothetical protein ACFFDP_02770 [Promethearchaeota archaeon]
MLHVIYLMANNGLCLLDQKFGELELDPNLVAGFFSAIRQFSQVLSKGKGEARVVEMGEFYVTYASGDFIVCAAVVDKDDNRLRILQALDEVITRFSERFAETLKEWDGKLVFFSFVPELTELLKGGMIGEVAQTLPKLKRGLPRLLVKLGQVTEQEFQVAKLCSGERTPIEIAEKMGLPLNEVEGLLYKLKKLDLISYE